MAIQTLTPQEGQAWISKHQQDIQKMIDAGGKLVKDPDQASFAPGGTGSDVINRTAMSGGVAALPNYGAPNVAPVGGAASGTPQMNLQGATAGVPHQGFTNLDPITGQPKMLPYTPGSGAGMLANILGDPTRVGSLLGKPGASSALAASQPGVSAGGGVPGAGGAPGVPGAGGPAGTPDVSPQGVLPNYLLDQFAGNLQGALKGELPADVQNLLAQQSAEYGVGSGTQGSQFQGYRGLRNLGLTSLDRMKQAEDILAGQITKPAEQTALDQAQQRIKDMEDQFNKSYGLDKQKLEAELKIEKDKFAQQVNEFNKKYELSQLEALGQKYPGAAGVGGAGGGFGSYTGITPGIDYGLSKTSPGQWEPMQFGVTSMI